MLVTGCWMLDTGCWMLDTRCWILDAGCLILDVLIQYQASSICQALCEEVLKHLLPRLWDSFYGTKSRAFVFGQAFQVNDGFTLLFKLMQQQ